MFFHREDPGRDQNSVERRLYKTSITERIKIGELVFSESVLADDQCSQDSPEERRMHLPSTK